MCSDGLKTPGAEADDVVAVDQYSGKRRRVDAPSSIAELISNGGRDSSSQNGR